VVNQLLKNKVYLSVLATYEKAISKMKVAMYTSDLATDISDKEHEKSRKLRFVCSCDLLL